MNFVESEEGSREEEWTLADQGSLPLTFCAGAGDKVWLSGFPDCGRASPATRGDVTPSVEHGVCFLPWNLGSL